MVSDVPICTFLSGGVDSSLVSAICARELENRNQKLHTYSFDFAGNAENFKASSFPVSYTHLDVYKRQTLSDIFRQAVMSQVSKKAAAASKVQKLDKKKKARM